MKGRTGVITFGDGSTSKIKVVDVETYTYLPTDYWLEYAEGETNKPLVHPDYGTSPLIKSELLIPEMIFRSFVKLDSEESN